MTCYMITKSFRKWYVPILELDVLLIVFAVTLSDTVFQHQVVYQVCTAVFEHNSRECSLLGTSGATNHSHEIETHAQSYAVKIFMTKILLENVVPAVGVLFIGPWSDKFGRKPLLMAAFIGFTLKYIIYVTIMLLSDKFLINPWFYVLGTIPESILGANCSFAVGCICYIADTTTKKQRLIRMAIYEACVYIGLLIGSLCISYLFSATSTLMIFIISGSIVFIVTIFTFIFLKESLDITVQQKKSKICSLFDVSLIKEMFKSCFEKRPYYGRMIILIVLTVMGLNTIAIGGSGTVFYLFVRQMFGWTIQDVTIYDAIAIGIQITGDVLGMFLFRKVLKFSAESFGIISYISGIADALTKGLATRPWHIYLGTTLGILRGIGSAMCNTILSNIVPPNDSGKVISLSRTIRALSYLASAPLYSILYDKTLIIFPGAFNFLNSGVLGICLILLAIVLYIKHSLPAVYK